MEFNYVRLRLAVATEQPHILLRRLYGSSTHFSSAYRRLACTVRHGVCDTCPLSATCAFHAIFGQQLSPDPVALKRFQKPPLPFVFTFPAAEVAGPHMTCELVLVGTAINHLFLFVDAFRDMLAHCSDDEGEEAPHLVSVESLDYDGTAQPLSVGNPHEQHGDVAVLDVAEWGHSRYSVPDMFGISLMSPLRLMCDGKVLRDFDISRFLRTLLRRVSAMAYYYCSWEMDADFRRCAEGAGEVIPIAQQFRYAAAHDQYVTAGVTGTGVFKGCPVELWQFLLMGELLHVGKGASFGMGCYRVTDTV